MLAKQLFRSITFLCLFKYVFSHPLDQLTPAETQQCSQIIQKSQPTSTGFYFNWITLIEPEKKILFPLLQQSQQRSAELGRIPRKCLAVIIERSTGRIFEGRVNLNLNRVEKWDNLPQGTQPLYAPEEIASAELIFRNDSGVIERCARLGYRNMEHVAGEPWAMGYTDDRPEWAGRRLMQIFPYGRNFAEDNQFAHPFDFIGIVDLIQERVIQIENLPVHHHFYPKNGNAGVTVPRQDANYDQFILRANSSLNQNFGDRYQTAKNPRQYPHAPRFQASGPQGQPQHGPGPQGQPHYGPGPQGRPNYSPVQSTKFVPLYQAVTPQVPFYRFKRQAQAQARRTSPPSLVGNFLKWENFQIQIGFNAREGLVLHNIWFRDGSISRPLIYRVSIVEMLVPYADPRPPFHRKAVFDAGEYGFGFWANSLVPGVDCPSQGAVFGHGTLNNLRGGGTTRQNIFCAYEDETGLLFKHVNLRNRRVTYGRNRRLIISSVSTIGNYDYGFFWIFSLDGSIEFIVKATGILDTELLAEGEGTYGYGIQVFPQINTPYHQHLFAARIDPMLDGALNSVSVVDVVPDRAETGSKQNPYGQAFSTVKKPLETVAEACTRIDPLKSRTWEIYTQGSPNPIVKEKRSWKFIPRNTAPILVRRDSPLFPKAGFTNYDVWVTEYKDQEIYPGGFYLNGRSGLPEIVKRNPNGNIGSGKDVVFWHVFGLTHIPRAEDFPIMPIEETGFIFRPHNFFLQNPALKYATTFVMPQSA